MQTSRRASGYDLFKLIVAIVLLILFLILRRGTSQTSTVITQVPPATMTLAATQPTIVPISPTSPAPTATASPIPALTATQHSEATPTTLPSPTGTPTVEPTATPGAEAAIASACEAASSQSHLQVGREATILRRLNFRSSPGIRDNWLLTNIPGTQVEVIGGPECVPYWTGAHVWWQIKLPDGRVGWSAERPLHGTYYFMEPRP